MNFPWLTTSRGPSIASGGIVEVGTTTAGGSTYSPTDRHLFIEWTAPQTGTLDRIYIYSDCATSTDIKLGLYQTADTPQNAVSGTPVVFNSVGTWSAQWKEFSVSFAVTATQKYRIGFHQASAGLTLRYAFGTGSARREDYGLAYSDPWNNYPSFATTDVIEVSVKARISY